MSEAILNIVVTAKGVPEANNGLNELDKNAARAEKSAKGLTSTMGLLSGALGALGISLGVMAVKDAADNWSDMTARLGLAVGGAEKAAAVMQRLQAVAKNTYSDIGTTTESFIVNAGVLRDLGKSTAQALDYTEALNNALVVSGAKAETAASVQEALSRAMALGKLQGDNLNTVIAKGGEVANVLAKEMGVSTLQLRKLGQEGKITGDIMYSALTKNLEDLREKANEMPATMQDAATAWGNAFTTIIGTVDQAMGSSGALGQALYDLGVQVGQSAGTIAQAFVTMQMLGGQAIDILSGALGGMFDDFDTGAAMIIGGVGLATSALIGLSATIMGPVLGAFAALTAAIMANPLGLLIGALATVTTAAYLFRDEISQIFGFDIISAAKTGVNAIIGAFVGGYEAIKIAWSNMPAAIEAVMVGTANAVVKAVQWMINKVISLFNTMFDGLNSALSYVGIEIDKIGNVDLSGMMIKASSAAKDMGESIKGAMNASLARDYVGELTTGLGAVWSAAGEVTQQFKDMNAALDGDAGSGMGGALGEAGKGAGKKGGGGSEKSRAAEKIARDMEHRLEALKQGLMTEEETVLAQYQKDLETLDWHLANKKISEQEYLEWKARVTREHEQEMQAIRYQSYADALSATGDLMGAMAQVVGGNNEKMLKAQRIFGAASALVSTYIGAAKALELPFPANLAAMAAVMAKGMALVAAIKSGSKSSASGGGSAGTTQAAAPQEKAPLRQMAEINVHGEVFNREQVIGLIEKINDVQKDGHVISWKGI
ncbi:MAG: tape measure protein [Brucellaceae bacterium]|jgi:tape measure domain-containing protein|nr:tape measure protein [Brucellaceae bacterium]